MEFVKTRWIAFLDDDDVIANNYVETFNSELDKFPATDVIIFRMYRIIQGDILPPLNTDNFYQDNVGISFALKTKIFKKGLKFSPSSIEDFNYLDVLRKNNYVIMISPYIRYFVNSNGAQDINKFVNNNVTGNRVLLNPDFQKNYNLHYIINKEKPFYFIMYILFICVIIFTIAYFLH